MKPRKLTDVELSMILSEVAEDALEGYPMSICCYRCHATREPFCFGDALDTVVDSPDAALREAERLGWA